MQTSAVASVHSRKFNAHSLAGMRIAHHGAGRTSPPGTLKSFKEELTGGGGVRHFDERALPGSGWPREGDAVPGALPDLLVAGRGDAIVTPGFSGSFRTRMPT